MSKRVYAAFMLAVLWSVTSCKPMKHDWIPDDATLPGGCDEGLNSSIVFRIKIPQKLSMLSEGRSVYYNQGEDQKLDTTDDPKDKNNLSTGLKKEYKTNPLHLDLTGLPNGWIRVRAILRDEKLKFMVNGDIPPGQQSDLLSGTQGMLIRGTAPWICQPKNAVGDNTDAPGKSVMTFFVNKGTTADLPINFVIIPRNVHDKQFGAQTPILIDPKIHNDG